MDWATIKTERLSNLLQTDKYMISDYPISQEEKEELILFRQLIRDLPQTYETANEAADNYPQIPLCVTE